MGIYIQNIKSLATPEVAKEKTCDSDEVLAATQV